MAADPNSPSPPRVLLLTARMGAGHDQVAMEMARRLRRRGAEVQIADVWDLQPAGMGRLVTSFYRFLVHRAPGAYELIYRIWLKPAPARRRVPISPVTRWAGRRLLEMVQAMPADLVVSTFHLGTQMLGQLRRAGELPARTASVCVDFAAHGLWVDPDVDANVVWSDVPARRLRAQGGRGVRRAAPVVRPGFRPRSPLARRFRPQLDGGDDRPVVLVVAGSWGAGEVETTVADLERSGRWQVVVATGTNVGLCRSLQKRGTKALGWIEDMAALIGAADVVVENAGGLTAMEAAAMGVPIVSYLPIPGHGRDNVEGMAAAGIVLHAKDAAQLDGAIAELASPAAHGDMTGPARSMRRAQEELFQAPAAEAVLLELLGAGQPTGRGTRRPHRGARLAEHGSPASSG